MSAAPEVGLLLPRNVVVSQIEPDLTEVSLVDPLAMLGVLTNADLKPIADEAAARLDRVAAALEA